MSRFVCRVVPILALVVCALLGQAASGAAQGVTTASIAGIVNDAQGQPVPGVTILAVHVPSGSTYSALSRGDGRYTIPGMRVGGPYEVTATLSGFQTQIQTSISLSLGVTSDVNFALALATVTETVTVEATSDPVFSSQRTGASTAVARSEIATLPTISGRISDVTRLTPQASGNSFAGQDNRLNNITVDGSFFNNSFGLGGQPGDRTGVAPISLESLEQVQVSVAPYDVRQGGFVGAAINSVTRSGTNQFTGSVYHRMRDDGMVGTEAAGATVNPGTFTFRDTGFWAGGPILRNRLFVFGNYENELEERPLHTFVANRGETPGGNVTRVLESDLNEVSAVLARQFGYQTGGFEEMSDRTPAKRYLVRSDFNLTNTNKISFRYNQLDSSSGSSPSTSSSAGIGRALGGNTGGLFYASSSYEVLENIKSGIGEWTSVIGSTMSNNLIVGYSTSDESRGDIGPLFPYADILKDGSAYITFGSEAFSVQNELRYGTFQIQNNFTKFSVKHNLTFGFSAQKYSAENVFWSCCPQSNYTYNSLTDFYTDMADLAANPDRTTSPVSLRRFKVRYSNVPDLDKPLQELQVWYSGGYVQDEWRPRRDLTVTGGVRVDVSVFADTAYENAKADALTFRDPAGSPVQFSTGEMPESKLLWSPRVAANWDLGGRQTTQLRLGTGIFTGPPLYVWISNQLGNTGVLIGETQVDNTTAFPFNPDPDRYKPANVTGEGANSFELNVTDPAFKFPQVWRSNAGIDHRLPWGMTGTLEYIYTKDVNGYAYYNANLPEAQTAYTGVDSRPRYTSRAINNTSPNVITNAFVLTNQSEGSSWNIAASVAKMTASGLSFRGAYSYGEAKNTIDPGSTASSTFNNNQHMADPNNPGLGWSGGTMGHRMYLQGSYSKEYFSFGATTISAFWEARPSQQNFTTRASYTFNGDANNDGGTANDLIYVPRDASEMNFTAFTASGRTFSVAEQVAAFEAYIQQDSYLKNRRGEYAERGGLAMPIGSKVDLSIAQQVFGNISGRRNTGEIRMDITNFGNLLNSDWGVGDRTVISNTGANSIGILTNPGTDAQGALAYRMATVNNELVTNTFQKSSFLSDVYSFMLSFRYTFN